jgi:hypothetical protein
MKGKGNNIKMSTEECKICKSESTPWVHINGHVCQDCANPMRWISVEEKLPPEGQQVILHLVYPPINKYVYQPSKVFGFLHHGKWLASVGSNDWPLDDFIKVTHWMEVPEIDYENI